MGLYNMKTLYLTDLDGTFLNDDAKITDESAKIINELISKGVLFTLSTARTHATVLEMFEKISLNVPLVLMNGVLIYDPQLKEIIRFQEIDKSEAQKVVDIFTKYGKAPMLYFKEGKSKIKIVYSDLKNQNQQGYINFRHEKSEKIFQWSSSPSVNSGRLIYIVTLDPYDELKDIFKEIKETCNVNVMFYSDNYTGCYFLEIMSPNISKGIAALKVKEMLGATEIVSFGDNLNDISIFEVSDRCYAVDNAHEDLKKLSTAVIGANTDDAVAKFIQNDANSKNR